MPNVNTGNTKVVTRRQVRTGLFTAISVLSTFLVILGLSTVDNPDGTPWLESSVIGQSLATLGLITAAVLPSLLGTRKDAAVARDQLENSHVDDPSRVSNVRDDMDEKHSEILARLDRFEERVDRRFDGQSADIRGLRRDIGRHSDKIADLERTEPSRHRYDGTD